MTAVRSPSWLASGAIGLLAMPAQPARATDEIQVYNAGIAEVGQLTIQQHLNYIPHGVKEPPFPGGLISHNSVKRALRVRTKLRHHLPATK